MLALAWSQSLHLPILGKFLDHFSMWQVPRSPLNRAYGAGQPSLEGDLGFALLMLLPGESVGGAFSSFELVDCQRVT